MEVILLERVEKLGNVGDVVNVKNGYARNFLVPQGKVLRATNENKAVFEAKRAEIEKENAKKREAAEKESKKVADKFVVILRQAGEDGRLYGSVSAKDISEAISENLGLQLERGQIYLNHPIKNLGVYLEKVTLHPEVVVNVNVNVARTAEEAKEAEKEFLNPSKDEKKEDVAVAEAAPVVEETEEGK